MSFTESNFENAVIEIFRDALGYAYVYGPDVKRDYGEPLYLDELVPAVERINPTLPAAACSEAIENLRNIESGSTIQRNRRFMDYLQNGVPVSYFAEEEQRSALVHLVDYGNVANNSFVVANQWTVVGNSEKRPDVVVFVLKSPSREEADASEAFLQLRNYLHEIPSLFVYNAFLVMSDLAVSKAGTITAGEDRFMAWKTKDGRYENTQVAQFDTFVEGIFEKARLLDILRNFICFPVRTRRFSARTINILRCARPRRPPCRRRRRTGAGASSGTRRTLSWLVRLTNSRVFCAILRSKEKRLMEERTIEAEGRWVVESPLGRMCLRARGEVVTGLSFEGVGEAVGEEPPVVRRARAWVADYFRGRFRSPDFAIDPRGTPFQLRVWAVVRELAVGETWSYGEVATALGCGSARAVGQALGRNPLLLLIPCHRVVGAHGQLGGYAGGLARKHALLALEGARKDAGGHLL